jgi:hypothetical protein
MSDVGQLFVRFDGESRRMRINGHAWILADAEAKARHFGAQLVVRIECEIYPNCPHYVPDLAGEKLSLYVPREGQGTPPPPEWKSRDYIRDILPAGDPHAEVVKAARWVKGFVSRSHASTSQSPSSRRKPSHSTKRVCIRRRDLLLISRGISSYPASTHRFSRI